MCQYLWHDVLEAADVVPGVADETGRIVELLPTFHESCKLAHVGKSLAHSLFADVVADALQLADGVEQGVHILLLAIAAQLHLKGVVGGGLVDVTVGIPALAHDH